MFGMVFLIIKLLGDFSSKFKQTYFDILINVNKNVSNNLTI
jgi:hypothetical protein